MQKDEEVGKVAQATPVVICEKTCGRNLTYSVTYYCPHSQSTGNVPWNDCGGSEQSHDGQRVEEGGGIPFVRIMLITSFLILTGSCVPATSPVGRPGNTQSKLSMC